MIRNKTMKKSYQEYMESVIRKEGFHYCFVGYSDFIDIDDPEFHELKSKYLEATYELGKYMNLPINLYQ